MVEVEKNNALEAIKIFACAFQTEFINHQVSLGDLHKRIRGILARNTKAAKTTQKKYDDLRIAVSAFDERKEKLIIKCKIMLEESTEQYFKEQNKLKNRDRLPRVCIKTVNNEKIQDFYRDEGVSKNKVDHISSNTAFDHIYKKKCNVFMENNLPQLVKDGDYQNPRLDIDGIRNHYDLSTAKDCKPGTSDQYWRKYWDKTLSQEDPNPDPRDYYKSTLVVPMTLKAAGDRGLFPETQERLLGKDKNPNRPTLNEKLLIGFVCFDHMDVGYFDENDQYVGWIFADAISQAFVADYILSDNSETYRDALEFLNKHKPDTLNPSKPAVQNSTDSGKEYGASVFSCISPKNLQQIQEILIAAGMIGRPSINAILTGAGVNLQFKSVEDMSENLRLLSDLNLINSTEKVKNGSPMLLFIRRLKDELNDEAHKKTLTNILRENQ